MAETVSTNQFKNGMHIEVDGQTWRIVEFQHVKPGKGGAFVRTKLKSLDTGAVVDRTFRAGEKFTRVHTEVKQVQYLYDSGDEVVFMDEETFAWGARGHRLQRHEARHARDGRRRQRAAVRERGRPGQGRPAGAPLHLEGLAEGPLLGLGVEVSETDGPEGESDEERLEPAACRRVVDAVLTVRHETTR